MPKTPRLIGIALTLLAVVSCSDTTALRSRYQAEKLYHEAERELQRARAFDRVLSDQQIHDLMPFFRRVSDYSFEVLRQVDSAANPKEHHELTYLAFQSSSRLSQLFYAVGEYDSSIALTQRQFDHLGLNGEQQVSALINLGQSLQADGQWDSALSVYNTTIEEFSPPVTQSGDIIYPIFNLPIHVFQVVSLLRDSRAVPYEFNRAQNYYQTFIHEYPGTPLAVSSRANLARLYEEAGQWEREIAELRQIADSTRPSYYNVRFKIGDIYATHLNRRDSAIAIFTDLLARTDPANGDRRATIQFKIIMTQMDQGEYAEARRMLDQLKNDFPAFYDNNPLAQYVLARSLDLDNKWERAEAEYALLIEKFPTSDEAMTTLLYLIEHFKKIGRDDAAAAWTEEARKHFERIAATESGNLYEARARFFESDLYAQANDWQRSVATLEGIFERYPGTDPGREAGLRAADIYRERLGDPVRADSLVAAVRRTLVPVDDEPENPDLLQN